MKMTYTALMFCILLGNAQATTGTFDTSNYQIISDAAATDFPANYDNFTAKCRDLGAGWASAIFVTVGEAEVLDAGLSKGCSHSWIGGSTNINRGAIAFNSIYNEYIPNDSGASKVLVYLACDVQPFGYQLETGMPRTISMICEKETQMIDSGREYSSPQSNYKLLIGSPRNGYTYWQPKCAEIGEGWAPALLNSQAELDFIFRTHNHTDLRRYWIGGYTQMSTEATITLSDYTTTDSGSNSLRRFNNVLVNRRFKLKSKPASTPTLGILCEKEIADHSGLEIASARSRYRKLVVGKDDPMTYSQWEFWCSDVGSGWSPAALNTEEEMRFVREGQRSFSSSVPYWIDGHTNADANDILPYDNSSLNYSGENGVIVSTVTSATTSRPTEFFDKNTFTFIAQSREHALSGFLCEKAKDTRDFEFESGYSKYKKIVESTANVYTHFVSRCTGLGEGWGPALLDTEIEHDFIKESQKGLSDAQDYFIGGSADNVVNNVTFVYYEYSPEPPIPLYTHLQGSVVYVSTRNTTLNERNNKYFTLIYSFPTDTTFGILCEKAKA